MNSISELSYVDLTEIDNNQWLELLNKEKLRLHLMPHALFTERSLKIWLNDKIAEDQKSGCTVKAILHNQQLAGWCGIQEFEQQFEIAIILDQQYWGLGIGVFYEILSWGKRLGHSNLIFNLLHTRPKYRFLTRMAKSVTDIDYLGQRFTQYLIQLEAD